MGTAEFTLADEIVSELNRRFRARERKETESGYQYVRQLKYVTCADGFRVSIQASSTHYCQPRDDRGPYHLVECGYPTAPMTSLAEWIEGEDIEATQTVWGYVPIVKVAEVLASHGGILSEDDAAAIAAATGAEAS